MRFLLVVSVFAFMLYGCDSTKMTAKKTDEMALSEAKGDTIRIANEELEYEIIIIEPGFFNWLVTQFPEEYYEHGFLRNRNIAYVAEFNRRVILPTRFNPDLYQLQIDYQPGINYGKEVDYLLYNYFIYFERNYESLL